MADSISTAQLRRLQTLYSRVSKSIIDGNTREARLAWATQFCERPISSFSDLTRDEAHNAINALQAAAGQPQTIPARRKRLTRDDAQRAGTDGRKDKKFAQNPQMAGAVDLAVIENYYNRLGWDRTRFDAWLRSPRSPLKKSSPQIRTVADANRVRWALKGMLSHAGLWQERKPA